MNKQPWLLDGEALERHLSHLIAHYQKSQKGYEEEGEPERSSRMLAKANALKEVYDNLRSAFNVKEPELPALNPGDKVQHIRFGGSAGKVVKLAKSGKRAYVKWPDCDPAYYEIHILKKVEGESHVYQSIPYRDK